MKPTPEQVIAWAREAGMDAPREIVVNNYWTADYDDIERLVTRAYEAGRKDSEGWKECVIEELIVSHIYSKQHENDPHKAIHDAISWNVEVALDPKVSKEAQDLFDRGYEAGRRDENEACARVCEHNAAFGNVDERYASRECAAAIRARGEQ